MRVGNPQFVAIDRELSEARLHRIGPPLQRHPEFPEAVNVELAMVDAPDRVRILIWERGVGPTESSGTGSCASAVAAAAFGGANREVDVDRPWRHAAGRVGARRHGLPHRLGGDRSCEGTVATLMRTLHEAIGAVETYSPSEERFNRRRRTAGLLLAPVVLIGVLLAPTPGLSPEAHRLAAIMLTVVLLWVSEALPMAVTAILGPMLAIVLQVAPARARARAVRRPDHLSLHRQLHARRGDVRARRRSTHRLHRALLAPRRHERDAHPDRLRRGVDVHLDVDQQHRDDGDDVPDRAVDRVASARAARRDPKGSASSRWR